jgi:hypothetical protein
MDESHNATGHVLPVSLRCMRKGERYGVWVVKGFAGRVVWAYFMEKYVFKVGKRKFEGKNYVAAGSVLDVWAFVARSVYDD